MQLILTHPTNEDIKIKMSTQTESPVNGNVSDNKEINQEFEAVHEKNLSNELPVSEISKDIELKGEKKLDYDVTNTNGDNKCTNLQFKIETIAVLEQSLSNEPVSEICENIALKGKNNLDGDNNTNSNGENNCILGDIIKENVVLLKNINVIVSENITNGIGCIQDANELELATQNTENIKDGDDETDKGIRPKHCLYDNSSKLCLTESEKQVNIANIDESLSENNKTMPENKSDSAASVQINLISQTSENDINKPTEDIKDCGLDTEKQNVEPMHADVKTGAKHHDDNIVVNEEIEMLSENPIKIAALGDEDVAMHEVNEIDTNKIAILPEIETTKPFVINDETMLQVQDDENAMSPETEVPVKMDEDELLPHQSDDIILTKSKAIELTRMEEKVLFPVQTCENIVLTDVADSKPQANKNLILPAAEEPVKMDEDELLPLQSDVISTETKDLKPTGMDEEVLLPVHTCENMVLPGADDSKSITMEDTHNNAMAEPQMTSVYVADDNSDQLKNDDSAMDCDQIHGPSVGDSTETRNENKNVENNKDEGSMEVDDIKIVNKEKDKSQENPNDEKDATMNNVANKDDILENIIEQKELTGNNIEQKVRENDTKCGDQEQNEVKDLSENDIICKDKKEEQVSGKVLEKDATINKNETKNLKNNDNPETTVENANASVDSIEKQVKDSTKDDLENVQVIDEDDVKIVELDEEANNVQTKENSPERQETKTLPVVCKLSNTLDILSDDEEEAPNDATNTSHNNPEEKQCINLDDDDDIMLIEEDSNSKDKPDELNKEDAEQKPKDKIDVETGEKHTTDFTDIISKTSEKDNISPDNNACMELNSVPETEKKTQEEDNTIGTKKPLLPKNILKAAKKNLAGMTRHELEDFCILRIVESIVDRSNLSEIKSKIKVMAQNLEEYKKRATMVSKQNRDLQVVLKSVQEEQKNQTNTPIQPLKITRSVGMQVVMNDKLELRKKAPTSNPVPTPSAGPTGRPVRAVQSAKQIKQPAILPNIPVPRKVPVNNSPAKALTNTPANSGANKSSNPSPNGLRNPSPVQKAQSEKRTHSRMQTTSVTVDLTDDEPPSKISNNKNSPSHAVRVVPPQNILAQQRQFPALNNNARKVYIPIGGPQSQQQQQIRAVQPIVMKNMVNTGPRPGIRVPIPRPQQSSVRPKQTPPSTPRHPAPLPESMKQYTPPTWKALPPAPDLKLSKVENGIVISWKIDGYPEGGYETIASYQLYAYQETTAPPCTALWKKIGDVKALPLPMACTLTQFMAGFKYYFAVRAVDIRSRLGPFSLPGSILLLNKM